MRQLYTTGTVAASHPTFTPERGVLQALSPFVVGFVSASFAWVACE
jgi:hypothetical protein